jgi:formiminotetrahydrofolate cyclodeaminase
MENYNNFVIPESSPKPSSGGSGLADVGGAVVGSLVSGVIGGLFAQGEAKKARQLQEKLEKLSLAQKKQLEERLQDVTAETERQSLVYQFLAVQNNNEMINRVQSKRYTSYIVLGVGVTILAVVVLKLSKK